MNVYNLLSNCFELNENNIEKFIPENRPGIYVLGKCYKTIYLFFSRYVGRSDDDLRNRLKQHLKENYIHFKFLIVKSIKEAFDYECKLYHELGGEEGKLDNKIHPDRPEATNWNCPVCDYFERKNYFYKLLKNLK